ncbi:hypothetical protein D3C86_2181250 [compost metagenome]
MMLMTESNSVVSPYQANMPAILDEEGMEKWLQPDQKDSRLLRSYLQPIDEMRMVANILTSPAEKLEIGADVSVFV